MQYGIKQGKADFISINTVKPGKSMDLKELECKNIFPQFSFVKHDFILEDTRPNYGSIVVAMICFDSEVFKAFQSVGVKLS